MIAPLAQAMNSPSENVNEIVRLTLGVKRVKIKSQSVTPITTLLT